MSQQTNAILESNHLILEAIKASSQPSFFGNINWAPIIQGVASAVAPAFGVTVSFSAPPAAPTAGDTVVG